MALAAGLQTTRLPNVFRFRWPATLPGGTYVWFVAITRPGMLDIIAIAADSMTFTP